MLGYIDCRVFKQGGGLSPTETLITKKLREMVEDGHEPIFAIKRTANVLGLSDKRVAHHYLQHRIKCLNSKKSS